MNCKLVAQAVDKGKAALLSAAALHNICLLTASREEPAHATESCKRLDILVLNTQLRMQLKYNWNWSCKALKIVEPDLLSRPQSSISINSGRLCFAFCRLLCFFFCCWRLAPHVCQPAFAPFHFASTCNHTWQTVASALQGALERGLHPTTTIR